MNFLHRPTPTTIYGHEVEITSRQIKINLKCEVVFFTACRCLAVSLFFLRPLARPWGAPQEASEDPLLHSSAAGQRRRLSWGTNFKWVENGENGPLVSLTGLPGPLLTPLSLSIQLSIMGWCVVGASGGGDGILSEFWFFFFFSFSSSGLESRGCSLHQI